MDLFINNQTIKGEAGEMWEFISPNYYISSLGRLASSNHRNTGKLKLMHPAYDAKGYLRTALVINGKNTTVKMHRLVAQNFIPNPENKPTVNHKNSFRDDNRVINLEWNTWKENAIHAMKKGRLNTFKKGEPQHPNCIRRGSENSSSKLNESQVLEIRAKFKPRIYTRQILGDEYGVSPATIKDIILRKSWKHI